MMRYYYLSTGAVKVGSSSIETYVVIKTEEIPHADVLAKGFQPIDPELSEDQIRERYQVETLMRVQMDQDSPVN